MLDLALEHHRKGNLDQAELLYRQILDGQPNDVNALHLFGVLCQQRGRTEMAVASISQAILRKPDFPEAHNNLGIALAAQGNAEAAAASYRNALRLKPDYALAHNNLAIVLHGQGRPDEAELHCRQAVALRPDFAEAHQSLGMALKAQGRWDEAAACFQQALTHRPDYAEAHKSLGMIRLLRGDYERGWPGYEWRRRCEGAARQPCSLPPWDGSDLKGKTILLFTEQGLGDTLQFVRYVPRLKQLGATVVLRCPESLVRILTTCAGIDRLVVPGADLPPCDVQAALLSLPGLFRTTPGDVPAEVPYLSADAARKDQWRRELAPFAGLKVGIAWQGSGGYRDDHFRSVPLAQFEPLARTPSVRLLSLQNGPGSEQLPALAGRLDVPDLGSHFRDFADTAAVVANLDLVITVDTSVAHLAGALGVPVWVALRFAPDWRWSLHREDSPWYPTMRLFRQTERGDWAGVFDRLRHELARRVECP